MTSFSYAILTEVKLRKLETRILSPFLGMLRIITAIPSAISKCLVSFIDQCLVSHVLLLVRMPIITNRSCSSINRKLIDRIPCSFSHLLLFKCLSRDNSTLIVGHFSYSKAPQSDCSRIMGSIRRLVIRYTIVYFYTFGDGLVLTLGTVLSL